MPLALAAAVAATGFVAPSTTTAATPAPAPVVNGDILVNISTDTPSTGYPEGDLYLVDRSGRNKRQLTRTGGMVSYAAFSPDGRRIVFARTAPENRYQSDLYVMRSDGTRVVRLTATQDTSESSPSFSRDGTKIGFVASDFGRHRQYLAYMAPVAGAPVTEILSVPTDDPHLYCDEETGWPTGLFDRPQFSPLGDSLAVIHACITDPNNTATIDIVGLRGKRLRTSELVPNVVDIDFRPDGKKIAFTYYSSVQDNPDHVLSIFDRETGAMTDITEPWRDQYDNPVFSPDGAVIAAHDVHDNWPEPTTYDLVTIKPDGTGRRVLVRGAIDAYVLPMDWRAAH